MNRRLACHWQSITDGLQHYTAGARRGNSASRNQPDSYRESDAAQSLSLNCNGLSDGSEIIGGYAADKNYEFPFAQPGK